MIICRASHGLMAELLMHTYKCKRFYAFVADSGLQLSGTADLPSPFLECLCVPLVLGLKVLASSS